MRKVIKARNDVAHGLWTYSDDAPDCLCTVEQKMVTDDLLVRLKAWRKNRTKLEPIEQYGVGAKLMAYSRKDFEAILKRMDDFDQKGLKLAHRIGHHTFLHVDDS